MGSVWPGSGRDGPSSAGRSPTSCPPTRAKRYGPPSSSSTRRAEQARHGEERGEVGVGDSGDPWTKEVAHEEACEEGTSEMQQWRRMEDGVARELPGKVIAGEERDEFGGGDFGRPFAIPWSWTKRTSRQTFGWSWIGRGRLKSMARLDGELGWSSGSGREISGEGEGAGRSEGARGRQRSGVGWCSYLLPGARREGHGGVLAATTA